MDIYNNSYWIVIAVFLLLIVIMGFFTFLGIDVSSFNLVKNSMNLVQSNFNNIINPVVETIDSIRRKVNSYWTGFFNAGELKEKNDKLRKEIALLEDRVRKLEESMAQNKRLKKIEEFLNAFKGFTDYETEGASVIGFSPFYWDNKMILNKGAKDGIREKMPVISYHGILVGQINQVSSNSSQVLMVNDPDFVVGGIVQDSRTVGLITGQADNNKINIMEKIPEDGEINKGDRILTSGLSRNFPKYLPVGEVKNVTNDNYGIAQIAEIELFIDQYTIEEVMIITEF